MLVDIFRPVPPEARGENLAAYQKFLTDRDGVMDLEKKQDGEVASLVSGRRLPEQVVRSAFIA